MISSTLVALVALSATPPVSITVAPATLPITIGQCNGGTITVKLTNHGKTPIYADASLSADPALHLPRSLITTWLPAGYTSSVPVAVRATRAGDFRVRVTAGPSRVEVPIRVGTPAPGAALTRLASRVTASSARAGSPACAAIDGRADTMWNDTTGKRWPDWWQLDWDTAHRVSRIAVTTTADGGLRDWDVQVAVPTGWQTVDSVRGNRSALKISTFTARATTAVRIVTLAGNGVNDQSRLVDVAIS
ncbi:coagulation factor 5/8 type domain-containing protein [Actinoplanes sp. SE50]|uniref:discoidin domain-containing protein n=1 Tax=unclassified Actinoplanes TaxID=2626549 RepID=UPI00023ECAE6|nr:MULTISPECIES: discoidin domain-containing protein [unclassified Actinoplanes]AEV83726.1 coagulation factor 5/8 type domain protein [Actinoplanes sp. SE50/110]ATO82130.1 coagulation factor 5/8 type domain-containing protein [Actinoplanes sp. SE50]SLL99537.1 coagulation factor 5/8 type domain-containing protein [Actinoplanes sp. SE50/110]